MEGLMTELADLSRRNDELLAAKDDDLAHVRELEGQVKEYKRKYEQAKTELRSAKGMFSRDHLFTWLFKFGVPQRLLNYSFNRRRLTTSSLLRGTAGSSTSTLLVSSHLSIAF